MRAVRSSGIRVLVIMTAGTAREGQQQVIDLGSKSLPFDFGSRQGRF